MRLAPLLLAGALTACIPPSPLSVRGPLPPSRSSYAVIDGGVLDPAVRAALDRRLAMRGMIPATAAMAPDRFISISFADRPRTSGTFATETPPASMTAPGWLDRPRKERWFEKGRREVRLSVRFLDANGVVLEERTATRGISRTSPNADMARMLDRMLAR